MKKLIGFIFIISICFHQQLSAQELKSEFLFDMEADLYTPKVVGSVLRGTRIFFIVKDSFVKSNKLIAVGVGRIPAPGKVAYPVFAIK